MGMGMVGSWIIYIDTDNVRHGSSPYYKKNEYIRAYNTKPDSNTGEHEYRYLGSYQTYRPDPGGSDVFCSNAMKIAFSQNGLRFIMARTSLDVHNGYSYFSGTVNLDTQGDPISASASKARSYIHSSCFYYGFRNNNRVVYLHRPSSEIKDGKRMYVLDWDVANEFFYAYGWNTDEDNPGNNYYINVVMVHGIVYEYTAVGQSRYHPYMDYSAPSATYQSLSAWVETVELIRNDHTGKTSCSVYGSGAFISRLKNEDEHYTYETSHTNDLVSIWIGLDGKGVDMGDALLDGAYTGGRLATGPMIQVTSIEEEE